MKGRDYIEAIFEGKYFIMVFICLFLAATAMYNYSFLPRNAVSVVLKSGSFVGGGGEITALVTPKGLSSSVNDGGFNGLIQQSLKLDMKQSVRFNAVNPPETDIVKITFETDNTTAGLGILHELVSQLSQYYDKEKKLKLHTISYKYIEGLRNQLSTLESSRIKKTDERKDLIKEKNILLKAPLKTGQDNVQKEEQIKIKEKQIAERRSEIEKIRQEIMTLRSQLRFFDEVLKNGKSIQIIQTPMIVSANFVERFIQNLVSVGILSLVLAILMQFIIYDFKSARNKPCD